MRDVEVLQPIQFRHDFVSFYHRRAKLSDHLQQALQRYAGRKIRLLAEGKGIAVSPIRIESHDDPSMCCGVIVVSFDFAVSELLEPGSVLIMSVPDSLRGITRSV